MIRIIIEGLILGLSTGAYCLSACFVFFMPYLLAEGKQKFFENLQKVLLFMAGRFIAYISFALIMGFIGVTYRDIFTAKFSYWSLVVASLLMLAYVLMYKLPDFKFCKLFISGFGLAHIPFFLGLFSGLNPCPPFLVGVARIWTLNSILRSVVLFTGFFLGTSVFMIPLIFVSYINRSERIKQIGLMVALLSSIWFLFVGISGLVK